MKRSALKLALVAGLVLGLYSAQIGSFFMHILPVKETKAFTNSIPSASVFTSTNDHTSYGDTAWHDVANTTLSHASLNSAGFGDTEEVIIIADINFDGNSAGEVFGVRVADTAGTAIANSTIQREPRTASDKQEIVRVMVKTTKTSNEGFVVQKASITNSANDAQVKQAGFVVLGIDDLTANDDYVWDDDTSATTLSTTSTTFATITTPSSDSNWQGDVLVMDYWVADNTSSTSTSLQHELQRDSDTAVNVTRQEGEDTNDLYGGGSIYVYNNPDTDAHTYNTKLYTSSGTEFDHSYSAIVAFRASLFEDFEWDNTDSSLDNPSTTAFTEVAGITPFSPQNSGDFVVLGFIVDEANTGTSDDGRIRLQVDGTNVPSGFYDSSNGTMREDPADRYGINLASLESFDTSSKDVDMDAAGDLTDDDWEYRTLVAFSTGLTDVPPTFTQNQYRWYVDNNGTNPTDPWSATVDLAENTAITVVPSTYDPPNSTQELRLRMNITVNDNPLAVSSQQFTLQFKEGTDGSCTTGSWTDVGAAATWEFATSSVTDGANITGVLSVTDVDEEYAKSNPTETNHNSATAGQDIEYDFHIIGTNISSNTQYSFRVLESDDTVLDAYTNCPTLTTEPGNADLLRHGKVYSEGGDQNTGFFWAK